MKRVKLDKPARVRIAKPSYDELLAENEDLKFQAEVEAARHAKLESRIVTIEHELLTIQQGYRNLVQKAEANTAARVRRMVENEFSKEVQSLTFRLAEVTAERDKAVKGLGMQARGFYEDGPNHSCPECGCVIRPVPLVNGKLAKPERKAR